MSPACPDPSPPLLPSRALAAAPGTTRQNAAKRVAALERKGYLALAPSPDDARTLSLTPRASATELEATSVRLFAELVDGVDDAEAATCLSVLNAMSHNLTGTGLVPAVIDPDQESRS